MKTIIAGGRDFKDRATQKKTYSNEYKHTRQGLPRMG